MKKILVSTALATIPSMAFSKSVFNNFKLNPTQPTDQAEEQTCVNFSGTWEGQCVRSHLDGGETSTATEIDSVTIKQVQCDVIAIEDDKLIFGGSSSTTETAPFSIFTYSIMGDWNENRSEALVKMSVTGRSLSTQPQSASYVFTGDGAGSFKIAGGRLITKNEFKYTNILNDGTILKGNSTESCDYTKVQ